MPACNQCRICLTDETNSNARIMHPLFDERNVESAEIVQKIEECGGIVLKPHDEFPKMICDQCLDSLNASYKFRSMCQASERALLNAIVKSELKTEPREQSPTSIESSPADANNEIFLELQTEFIDAEEVDFEDITTAEGRQFIEMEDNESEYLEEVVHSDSSDYVVTPKSKVKRKLTKRKIRPVITRKTGRRGRPRTVRPYSPLEETGPRKIKSGSGRKKLDVEQASIMCEICGNIYAKRSLLNMHMRRHMSQKPFECEICGKCFACPSEISRHMRVHTGEKPYVCKFCGRTFADRSTNIKHERIHTNERPFSCQTCGKSFTYSNVLKNHMLTHTGEKPFPCLPCNKTFSRKHQLDQHCSTLTHQQTVKNLSSADVKEGTQINLDLLNMQATNE